MSLFSFLLDFSRGDFSSIRLPLEGVRGQGMGVDLRHILGKVLDREPFGVIHGLIGQCGS